MAEVLDGTDLDRVADHLREENLMNPAKVFI